MKSPTASAIRLFFLLACLYFCIPLASNVVFAADKATKSPSTEQTLISLNFPDEVDLKSLVEYVSLRLKINFLYDEQVGNKKVTIKSPLKIPQNSLFPLLEEILRSKSLVIVDGEQPGWKHIVQSKDLLLIAPPLSQIHKDGDSVAPSRVVSQVFTINHTDIKRVESAIKPLMTQPGGNTLLLPEQQLLIVTDFAGRMQHIGDMIALLDKQPEDVELKFIAAKHLEASELARDVQQLLSTVHRAQGITSSANNNLDITSNARANQVILVGSTEQIEEAAELIDSLDVPLDLTTKIYQFDTGSPERADQLVKMLIGEQAAKRVYRSTIDKELGKLIVTTTADIHETINTVKADLDVPIESERNPIRFYKLANTTAGEVLSTISAIEQGAELSSISLQELSTLTGQPPEASYSKTSESTSGSGSMSNGFTKPRSDVKSSAPGSNSSSGRGLHAVQTKNATVTADENTNTIIVVAEPHVHKVYEQLIKMLDRRRPQVLVEVTLVTLDTSDSFSLGVEISASKFNTGSIDRLLTFSSFGLSDVDATTGQLSLIPGLGFNGTMVSADIADVVVRALQSNGRAKVLSAPRILVNDNATGTLSSVAESPYTSVNSSTTVSTTSFGGYASAGTTISVTPHISEGDHLQLSYSVNLSAFSGSGSDGIPAPRQTNTVTSDVVIPDGNTIIVGGLTRHDISEGVTEIPILGEIPIIEHLFQSESETESLTTLFVFIKPIILRDDQFEDLKFYSNRDLAAAEMTGDYPASEPRLMQ